MSYRRANGLLLVTLAFVLCAFVAFLLYKKEFFAMNSAPKFVSPISFETSTPLVAPVSLDLVPVAPIQNNKILKSFGSCGDESKNNIILSYAPDLVNALLDDIQSSHCEAPKPGFPNYSFILQDPSRIRIAEMTPDYQYIFYLKVETTDTSSTYFLYKTDIPSKQTSLLDTYTISSDWPLQKDFYEDKLMPRQSGAGDTLQYFWFIEDPKGNSNPDAYLEQKEVPVFLAS